MNTLLIGARSSGKTTLGRAIVSALHLTFIDLDEQTLATFEETTVRQVWAAHGETAWRAAETRALQRVLESDDQIIALGGGTPMIASAQARIAQERRAGRTLCVYLHCDAAELAKRLAETEGDRPSLTGASLSEEIAGVLSEREPTYRALADAVLDVTALSIDDAVRALLLLVTQR